ncbi:MAG: DUF1573 domain-containing protein, partial [Pontiellaceae bacterium]|nr:DUF1573 domain-containing protein [Pontiellaceae bacterium]
ALFFPMAGLAETGPKLVCDAPVYEFGTVNQSAVVTNVFIIRNEGDTTFVAGKPHVSCGCTTARLSRQMIGPGETAEVIVTFTAAGRSFRQRKSIGILSADSPDEVLVLRIQGYIEPADGSVPPDAT